MLDNVSHSFTRVSLQGGRIEIDPFMYMQGRRYLNDHLIIDEASYVSVDGVGDGHLLKRHCIPPLLPCKMPDMLALPDFISDTMFSMDIHTIIFNDLDTGWDFTHQIATFDTDFLHQNLNLVPIPDRGVKRLEIAHDLMEAVEREVHYYLSTTEEFRKSIAQT